MRVASDVIGTYGSDTIMVVDFGPHRAMKRAMVGVSLYVIKPEKGNFSICGLPSTESYISYLQSNL